MVVRTGTSRGENARFVATEVDKTDTNWDYRELRERINDSFSMRAFTLFDSHSVPLHDAFNRAFNRITLATLAAINQLVVQIAVELGLEDGKQLRADTTVDVAPLCYTSLSL